MSNRPKRPREESKEISEGKKEPRFIGPKSKEAYIQEIWSLYNTKEAFRSGDWQFKVNSLKRELEKVHGVRYSDQEWQEIFKRKR